MRHGWIPLVTIAVAACGASSSVSRDRTPASDAGNDSSSSVSTNGAASDAGDDSGRYRQGVYLCCAEGEGRTCCAPETLPDPRKGRSATCFQYGGARGACVPAGDTLEAKDV